MRSATAGRMVTEITAEEFNAMQAEKPRKYRNQPTMVDDIPFDSQAEARRYGELKLMEREGKIDGLVLQPRFPLTVNGVKIGTYVGDFLFYDKERQVTTVEDVKGVPTPVYRIKRRLMQALHGIEIVEVKS